MPSQSLAELHEQARTNYVYWPLWLILKRKQIEQLLAETGGVGYESDVKTSPEVNLLRQSGIPLPDDLTAFTLPSHAELVGTRFWFDTRIDGDYRTLAFKRQLESGQVEVCDLLCAKADDGWYIGQVMDRLNKALERHAVDRVFNATRLWVSFHGQPVPDIRWHPVQDDTVHDDSSPPPAVSATGWE